MKPVKESEHGKVHLQGRLEVYFHGRGGKMRALSKDDDVTLFYRGGKAFEEKNKP